MSMKRSGRSTGSQQRYSSAKIGAILVLFAAITMFIIIQRQGSTMSKRSSASTDLPNTDHVHVPVQELYVSPTQASAVQPFARDTVLEIVRESVASSPAEVSTQRFKMIEPMLIATPSQHPTPIRTTQYRRESPFAPIPPYNASRCPSHIPVTGNCIHANNKLECAPLRGGSCKRPCGAFALKLRGAGGVLMREGLLMALFGGAGFGKGLDESFIVSEGWALGTALVVEKTSKFRPRDSIFITTLRQPINRIISRYWYEGRWEMGRPKDEIRDQTAVALGSWVNRVMSLEAASKPPARS